MMDTQLLFRQTGKVPSTYKCECYIRGGHPKAQQQGMLWLMPCSVSSTPAPQLPASSYGAERQSLTSPQIPDFSQRR